MSCDRTYLEQRRQAMITERSSFIPHYQEISKFITPRSGRFFHTDRNRGDKRYQSIINSRGTQASRSARAGLLAGVMSPSRPWFTMQSMDPDMMKFQPVQEWFYKVDKLLATIFTSSNVYNMAPVMLGELLNYATGCMSQVEDFEHVTRFYTYPVGSYMIAQNDRYQVDTVCRELEMTVRQLVNKFGANVSQTVQNLYDQGKYEAWVPVVHFVEPNPNFDDAKSLSQFKKYCGIYYEPGAPKDQGELEYKGFDDFPLHCPRWDVTGEDIYGTDCPGMTALGDIKGLQAMEREKAKAIQKMVDPPLRGPPSLRNIAVNSLPGGLTLYDGGQGSEKLEPIYTVNPNIAMLVEDIKHHEARINEAFYVDLFRSIDSMEGVQPQNQLFLSMKNAEKLLQLGPVLERIHGEFLNPMIDRTFALASRAGILPPAPPELQGQQIKVRYISSLAMAQREVATQSIDKLTMFIGGLAQMGMASALDKFDGDAAIDAYAMALGVPPTVIVSEDKVLQARQAKQQQADQQHQMQMMQGAAGAAQQGAQAVSTLAGAGQQMGAPK